MNSMKQASSLWKSRFDLYPSVSLLVWAILTAAFISFLIGFVGVMLSDIYEWSTEKFIKDLLGVQKKYEALKFLGIGMGGIVLVSQAFISYKRAKAMENAAKAQAKATEEQAEANVYTEQGQRQERLKNAIEHLGHNSVSIRLGGAYELFHLAQDTEELRQTVLDILCAHIRQTTSDKKYQKDNKSKPSEEIQSLLTLLFVQEHKVFEGLHINLQGSWLNGARLNKARLVNAVLDGAHLRGASLIDARLRGARLFVTELQEASLFDVQLQGTILIRTSFQRARLDRAQLQGAIIESVRLQGAQLGDAQLQGALLNDIFLQGSVLVGAQLHGVFSDLFEFSSFEKRIRDRIGKKSALSGVTFEGGINEEYLNSLTEGLTDNVAQELRSKLNQHIDKPAGHILPENSGAITGSFTKEEAEQWIAEYNKVVTEDQKENDS